MASNPATHSRVDTPSEPTTPIRLLKRDKQAAERRRQLVRAAGALIEEGGVEYVTIPRVSTRAGCTRTLVYRYFASREEILFQALSDYFERLDQHMPEADQRAAVRALTNEPEGAVAISELIGISWDAMQAAGMGGAILRSTPQHSPAMQALIDESRNRHERRFSEPLCEAGLSEFEAAAAIDSMIATFVRLALRARAGEISRKTAIDIHTRATVGLIGGLL